MCLSIYLPSCLSNWTIYLSAIYLSMYLLVYLTICLSDYPIIYLSVYLSICLCNVYVCIYRSIDLSVYLTLSIFLKISFLTFPLLDSFSSLPLFATVASFVHKSEVGLLNFLQYSLPFCLKSAAAFTSQAAQMMNPTDGLPASCLQGFDRM